MRSQTLIFRTDWNWLHWTIITVFHRSRRIFRIYRTFRTFKSWEFLHHRQRINLRRQWMYNYHQLDRTVRLSREILETIIIIINNTHRWWNQQKWWLMVIFFRFLTSLTKRFLIFAIFFRWLGYSNSSSIFNKKTTVARFKQLN